MKFGFMGWLQLPKPWGPDSEFRIWNDGLEEIELCDRIGIMREGRLVNTFDDCSELNEDLLMKYASGEVALV